VASRFEQITDLQYALSLRQIGLAWVDNGGGSGGRILFPAAPEMTLREIEVWMQKEYTYYALVEE
jgi:hypothetical protein